jgi:hypothetical protein
MLENIYIKLDANGRTALVEGMREVSYNIVNVLLKVKMICGPQEQGVKRTQIPGKVLTTQLKVFVFVLIFY